MSLARTYSTLVLSLNASMHSGFPYPKEVKEGQPTLLVERDETGNYFKITYPGNPVGMWIPKSDFVKDFRVYPISFKKNSDRVYRPEVQEGRAFLLGKTKSGYYRVVFPSIQGSQFIGAWVIESDFLKDFKRPTASALTTLIESIVGAPAPPVAPATPARVVARGRPRKNSELGLKRCADEELVAEVRCLKARIEELERNK